MSDQTPRTASVPERVPISCPGCGRNDYVTWSADQPTYHWKCFNCGKTFDLTRKRAH